MAASKYQKFEMRMIRRSDIKNAEYNPRTIDEEAQKRLKKGLKKHGLVCPLTWNERTGNLVAGHQRLAVLDQLENGKDYDLNVAVIDVPEDEEKIINVQMNNPSMMGEWDIEKLKDLKLVDNIEFTDLGFTDVDVAIMFGDDERLNELFVDDPAAARAKETLKDIKADRAQAADKLKADNSIGYYFVVVCESTDDRTALMQEMGVAVCEEYVP